MKLSAKAHIPFHREPFIALIEEASGNWRAPIRNRAIIAKDREPSDEVTTVFVPSGRPVADGTIVLPSALNYLAPGDIVRVNPEGQELRVLYRKSSRHNSLLLTERCNSRCVMCSQPPRRIDDGYIADELLEAIPLMSPGTPDLGFSGGEPTLLGDRLIELIRCARDHLPKTALHVLSNGRLFRYLPFVRRVADVKHHDLMFGIPLYSDIASKHDYVVQAKNALNETILGLLNLGRVGVKVEIRVVVHRETYERLPQIARFISRNLPFVEWVALMGLEFVGFARTNVRALWINPKEYASELSAAMETLNGAGIPPCIYNHPHCLLPQSLWPFARQSISDWKNVFPDRCGRCRMRFECCGLFDSSVPWLTPLIEPL